MDYGDGTTGLLLGVLQFVASLFIGGVTSAAPATDLPSVPMDQHGVFRSELVSITTVSGESRFHTCLERFRLLSLALSVLHRIDVVALTTATDSPEDVDVGICQFMTVLAVGGRGLGRSQRSSAQVAIAIPPIATLLTLDLVRPFV